MKNERDKLYRVVVFPKRTDVDIKSILETSDKAEAIAMANEAATYPDSHNVCVSEFELHFVQFVFDTSRTKHES